jgi:hypothetical protein
LFEPLLTPHSCSGPSDNEEHEADYNSRLPPSSPPSPSGDESDNTKDYDGVENVVAGDLDNPEDIAVDRQGNIFYPVRPSLPFADSIPDGEQLQQEILESDTSGSNYSSDVRRKKKMITGTRPFSPEAEQEDNQGEVDGLLSIMPLYRKVCW